MRYTRILVASVVVSLLTVFLFGGLSHALIPHSHHGSETAGEVMHSALRHENKQPVTLPATLFFFTVLCIVNMVVPRHRVPYVGHTSHVDMLRRGTIAYRRFG